MTFIQGKQVEELIGKLFGKDFETCPACRMFTSEPFRKCVKCGAQCCTSCQSVDGTDCMGCGVSDDWKKAVGYGQVR